MQQKSSTGTSKAARGGDTGRTSSQGRKESSGGLRDQRGNPQIDEASHSPKSGQKKASRKEEKRA
jgi:hypothetical protein